MNACDTIVAALHGAAGWKTDRPERLVAEHRADVLHEAADAYERDQAEKYPGAIYGAIRRIRAYRVGAFLRRMAEGGERT